MTFKLLKRRYRSTDEDENLRRLEYFNHPYEPGNDIKLIDDVELDKPVSVALLGNDLVGMEQQKRGQKNATKRGSDEEEYVDMVADGILDPAKVTRSALQNACSVASTLLTTESVVANIKEETPAAPANGGGMGGMM